MMWLKAQGYAMISSPDGAKANLDGFQADWVNPGINEYDTMSCGHCNRITHVKAKMDPAELGGLCKVCMRLICSNCVGKECVPFEKKLADIEQKDYIRRQYAMLG